MILIENLQIKVYLFGILNSFFFNISQIINIIEELNDEGVKVTIFGNSQEKKSDTCSTRIENIFSNIQDTTKLKIGLISGSMWIFFQVLNGNKSFYNQDMFLIMIIFIMRFFFLWIFYALAVKFEVSKKFGIVTIGIYIIYLVFNIIF